MESIYVLAILLVVSLMLVKWLFNINSLKIPGPLALPIIGHLHLFGNKSPAVLLTSISRKHGPLVQLHLGSETIVFASSAEMAEEILKVQDHVFGTRELATGLAPKNDLVFSPSDEQWRKLKGLCMHELLSRTNISSFEASRMEEMSSLLSQCYQASTQRKPVDVHSLVTQYTNNTLCEMLLGRSFMGPNHDETDEIRKFIQLRELSERLAMGGGDLLLKWFKSWFISSRDQKFLRTAALFIEEYWAEAVRISKDKGFVNKIVNTGTLKTEEDIGRYLHGVFAPGTDAVTVAIEWCLGELIVNRGSMAKAQAELLEVAGAGNIVQESHFPQLKYLNAIVKEGLRLHAPVPLTIAHMSMNDTRVGGYHIPKGTRVLVNLRAIGRDPKSWEEPDKFLPERFMERRKEIDVWGHHFELIPFGSGRRGCPGMPLAIPSIKLVLANLVHAFDWELAPGMKTPFVEHGGGIVAPMAVPLKAVPKLRWNSLPQP